MRRLRHGFQNLALLLILRRRPRDLPYPEHASVPRKKMLETKTHFQVPIILPDPLVIGFAIAQQLERLRRLLRSKRLAFKNPQIPVRAHVATAIVVHIIFRQFQNPRRIQGERAQVLLEHRSLGRIHGANFQMRESRLLGGEGNRAQKFAEPLQQARFPKFLQPNAQIRLIRHGRYYTGVGKSRRENASHAAEDRKQPGYFFLGGNSSSASGPKSVESPSNRAFKVSPIDPSASEQVSRNRFSAALAIVSSTVCECCPKVVAEASSQEFEAFSNRVLYSSIASSFDLFSCSIHSFFSISRRDSHCSISGPSCDSRCTVACSTPCIMRSSIVF